MPVPKQAFRKALASYYEQGIYGDQAIEAIRNRKDAIGQAYRDAEDDGMTKQDFANIYKIHLDEVNQNPSFMDKLKSHVVSGSMGLSDAGAGIVQGAAYLGDKANEKINAAFGANLETHAYDKYNKEYKLANQATEKYRSDAGRTGTDITRTGVSMAAQVPVFMLGRGKTFTSRAVIQGGLGAATGAASYAEDSNARMGNMASGAVGGVLGQGFGEKVVAPVVGKISTGIARNAANRSGSTLAAAKTMVDDASTSMGIVLPQVERDSAIKSVAKALSKGKQQDAEAVVRKSFLNQNGISGTQSQITRDPMVWANERELAKHSYALNQAHIEGNQKVAGVVQKLADDTGASVNDTQGKMTSLFDGLRQYNTKTKDNISQLYKTAQDMPESDIPINHNELLTNLQTKLKSAGYANYFKPIKNVIENKLQPTGILTMKDAETAKQLLNNKISTTGDGNEIWALGKAKEMIDKHIDATIDTNPALGNAKNAWVAARTAYRDHAQTIDNTPALAAAIKEKAPDKAFQEYILNANTRDIESLVNVLKKTPNSEQAIADLQGAAIDHFSQKATAANNGAFSPSQFARAIDGFGENRMKALFSPEQIKQLADSRKIADIVLQQPLGAHVNHSNTANVVVKQILGLTGIASKIPYVGNMVLGGAEAAAKLSKGGQAAKMLNGEVPTVAKNSILGLTPEQLDKIGVSQEVAAKLAAAITPSSAIESTSNASSTKPVQTAEQAEIPLAPEAPIAPVSPNAVNMANGQMPAAGQMPNTPALPTIPNTLEMPVNLPNPVDVSTIPDMPTLAPPSKDEPVEGQASQVPTTTAQVAPETAPLPTVDNHTAVKTALHNIAPINPEESPQAQTQAQVVRRSVDNIMVTPQVQKIVAELDKEQPNEQKIKVLQKELSKSDEWQSFVKNLPQKQQRQASSADVLSLITKNIGQSGGKALQPQF